MKIFSRKLQTEKIPNFLCKKVAAAAFCFFALAAIAGQFSELNWLCNLFSHFSAQFFGIFAAYLIFFAYKRNWGATLVSALILAVNAAAILPYYMAPAKAGQALPARIFHQEQQTTQVGVKSPEQLRIMQLNVLMYNTDFESLALSIGKEDADLLAFEEFNEHIKSGLNACKALEKYPYSIQVPNTSIDSQLALFSKKPFAEYSVSCATASGDPVIDASIEVSPDRKLRVLHLHPRPPRTPALLSRQKMHFALVEKLAAKATSEKQEEQDKQERQDLILIGDLNSSPFASPFKRLLNRTGLKDTRMAMGLLPTWPNYCPLIAIPIDHILISQRLECKKLYLTENTGSDHFGLVLDLNL